MKLASLRRLMPFIGLAAFAVAAFLVWREVRPYGIGGMIAAMREIPVRAFAAAAAFSAGSYFILTLFDALAVRYAGHRLGWPRVALASFVALSIGHSLGLAPLGSGALRARYYARWGLDAVAIGKIVLFCAATVTIGQATLAGVVLLIEPRPPAAWLHIPEGTVRLVGILCLAAIAAYLGAAWRLRRPVRIRGRRWALPSLPLAAGQVVLGLVNFILLAAALYVLLAATTQVSFWKVAAIYVLASVAALVSHVPGGLGVIEFVVLAFLPEAGTWGALIAFRLLYYIVPLMLGGLVVGLDMLLDRPVAAPLIGPAGRRSRR